MLARLKTEDRSRSHAGTAEKPAARPAGRGAASAAINLAWLFTPQVVVVGGGRGLVSDLLLSPAADLLHHFVPPTCRIRSRSCPRPWAMMPADRRRSLASGIPARACGPPDRRLIYASGAEMSGQSWMRAEIFEQPAALAATIDALPPRVAEVRRFVAETRSALLTARGTDYEISTRCM